MDFLFLLAHVDSTSAPEKRELNAICLIRWQKGSLFFHWPPLFLTDMSRLETCQSKENACNHWADVVID